VNADTTTPNGTPPLVCAFTAEATPPPCNSPAVSLPLPLDLVPRRSLDRARKWMQALQPALERWEHPGVTHAELERGAVAATERLFDGEAYSARHVRRMIAEAIFRDAGRCQWGRVELYLEKNPSLPTVPTALRSAPAFDDLLEVRFDTPGRPNAQEEENFLREAWRVEQGLLLRGVAPKKARADLNQFLWQRAPWLSDSRDGLTAKVARKFRTLEREGTSLDGRAARAGVPREPESPQDYKDLIIWTAAKRGGRVAQGIDDLLAEAEQQGLPAEFVEFLITMRGPGSEVNRRLMAEVKPEVDMLRPYFLGKKAIDDATAPLRRCYEKLRSMQCVTADDFTLNAYFSVPDGKGWFTLNLLPRRRVRRTLPQIGLGGPARITARVVYQPTHRTTGRHRRRFGRHRPRGIAGSQSSTQWRGIRDAQPALLR